MAKVSDSTNDPVIKRWKLSAAMRRAMMRDRNGGAVVFKIDKTPVTVAMLVNAVYVGAPLGVIFYEAHCKAHEAARETFDQSLKRLKRGTTKPYSLRLTSKLDA